MTAVGGAGSKASFRYNKTPNVDRRFDNVRFTCAP